MMQQAIAVRTEGREKNAPNFDSGASQGSVMASATRILVAAIEYEIAVSLADRQVILQADHEPADGRSGHAIPSPHEIPSPKPVEITLAQSGRALKLRPKRALRRAYPWVFRQFLVQPGRIG